MAISEGRGSLAYILKNIEVTMKHRVFSRGGDRGNTEGAEGGCGVWADGRSCGA